MPTPDPPDPPDPFEAPVCAPLAAAPAAAAPTRRRAKVWRHFLVVGGLCVGIALFLTALEGHSFFQKLVYSLSIGTACTLIVDSTRLAVAWGLNRLRARQGQPPLAHSGGWASAIPGGLIALLLGPSLGMTLADWLTGNQSPSLYQWSSTNTRVTLALSVVGTVISFVVISTQERLATARALAEAAQRQAAETQLRLLQSQLEPHMLFNTLANLRVLIGLEPVRAQAMLDRLISFLRATLNASRLAAHPLATEFDRINDYLALMAVRMGPRLQVTLDLPTELSGVAVPPLLLQPLVENAIKHGLEPHVEGGRITVVARAESRPESQAESRPESTTLVLTVRDTGTGLPAAPSSAAGSHFGLAQVRDRLATLHGKVASLTLEPATDGQGGTLVTLRLPMPMPMPIPMPIAKPLTRTAPP